MHVLSQQHEHRHSGGIDLNVYYCISWAFFSVVWVNISILIFLSEFSFCIKVAGAFLGHVAQSTKKINPFFLFKVICHSCVNFTLLIVCVWVVLFAWMHVSLNVQETCELTLHLHSYLQIKAKNYDKVEKVSVHHTHKISWRLISLWTINTRAFIV